MKKLYALLVLGLAGFVGAQAQSYSFDPSQHVSTTVDPSGTVQPTITIDNLLSGILEMSWQLDANTFPATWTVQICDNATCVVPGPGTVYEMNPVASGGSSFLKAMITPNGNTGMGTISVLVWERGHSATPDTVSFTAQSIVGIEDQHLSGVALSPNPVSETLRLVSCSNLDAGTLEVFGMNGNLVLSQSTPIGTMVEASVASLAPGIYVVNLTTDAGSFRQKFVKL
jgi:Secretion system C-terminal sorting domain